MEKVARILAPTDLSELSRAGVRKALEFTLSDGSEVIVYHVVEPSHPAPYVADPETWPAGHQNRPPVQQLVEHHKILLARFMQQNFADAFPQGKLAQEVELGVPDKKIVEKAAAAGIDLIVMSTHGRTGLSRVLAGSITEKVVRLAACRVLTVHPGREEKAYSKD